MLKFFIFCQKNGIYKTFKTSHTFTIIKQLCYENWKILIATSRASSENAPST